MGWALKDGADITPAPQVANDSLDVAEATLTAYQAAMRDGHFEGLASLMDDNVLLDVFAPFAMFNDMMRGKAAAIEMLRMARDPLAERSHVENIRTMVDSDHVLIECEQVVTIRGTPFRGTMAFVFRIQARLVCELRIYLGGRHPGAMLRAIPPEAGTVASEVLASEVLAVEAQLVRAVLSRDRESAERVLADDFVATGHAGNVVDRAAYLDIHFSPERRFVRFDTEDRQVATLGTTALVTGRVTMVNDKLDRNPPPARYSALYVPLDHEGWVLLHWQETPIVEQALF